MKKILFLPFLQIPSGHHHVADALIDGIKKADSTIQCEKVDILHYGYGIIENIISNVYIKWISYLPQFYSWIYRKSVCDKGIENKRFYHYELLFLNIMRKMCEEKKPDVIVCTHALPSYMLSQLKQKGVIQIPIINVYTDYFINRLWGVEGIDYHFAPSIKMKQFLVEKGIPPSSIYVTGIPIHYHITEEQPREVRAGRKQLVITGGNLGIGLIDKLVQKVKGHHVDFHILCGKNKRLYERLLSFQKPNIKPIPYVHSKKEMDLIYKNSDGIITKPGGVTISESLFKRIPIFIYHTLPGQEEMNYEQLKQLGLVHDLKKWKKLDIEEEILHFYEDKSLLDQYNVSLQKYHEKIELKNPAEIITSL